LCIKAQKVHFFRPSLGFLFEAEPRLENKRWQKALFGRSAHNVFRVRLSKNFEKHELIDRCQVRYINWKFYIFSYNGCFFKFGVEVGVELSIVNALYRLRIMDQLFKSYAFTRVVRSQSNFYHFSRYVWKRTRKIINKFLVETSRDHFSRKEFNLRSILFICYKMGLFRLVTLYFRNKIMLLITQSSFNKMESFYSTKKVYEWNLKTFELTNSEKLKHIVLLFWWSKT
jgi:hypothetical protein